MLTLGLSGNFSGEYSNLGTGMGAGFFHDAAACLLRDGRLIAAVEEERLNRIKKTTKFPVNAIRACLSNAGVAVSDIEAVGYYFTEAVVDRALTALSLNDTRLPVLSARDRVRQQLLDGFGIVLPDDRILFAEHHEAHAASAFARSGMAEALVVVMDGRGDRHSTTLFHSEGAKARVLGTYDIGKSLGYFYASAIRMLGYGLGDEYKIMGLAPYGDSDVYRRYFESLYTLKDDGDYVLRPVSAVALRADFAPRRHGQDFTQQHKDFAASVQRTLEKIAMHVISYWASATGLSRLCFTGGVAHNSSLNGVILKSGLFREVFIHPASHDAGAAEGAAILAELGLGVQALPVRRLRSASLGPDIGTAAEIEHELAAWSDVVVYERCEDIVGRTAGLLADGAVVGWAQGASEFGPRALGNRSILADPRPVANRDRINAMVKKREAYRPFAPAVLSEAAADYFDLSVTSGNHDFMSFVVDVREERRAELGAVTHIDGSARVQVVAPESNERFHGLIRYFGEITGTPVLLNTSFNNNAEPIVQSIHDALTCFLTTGLDLLVIGDFLVRRRAESEPDLTGMTVAFRPVTRVTQTRRLVGAGDYRNVLTISLDHAKGDEVNLSAGAYALLEKADGRQSLHALVGRPGLSPELRREIFGLWQRRFIDLRPQPLGL